MPVDSARLDKIVGTRRHQGVIAFASQLSLARNLDELLDAIDGPPLLLVLDGITDPHNLGACLRVADGVGAHAVIVPKDRAVGLNATAAKVASGAAETVPYITVTNLARTLRELKERGIWLIGTSDDGEKGLYEADFTGPTALVMGSEGEGMRRLTRETCDVLVSIPMFGSVESLNVSVASGVCLYEARRQRLAKVSPVIPHDDIAGRRAGESAACFSNSQPDTLIQHRLSFWITMFIVCAKTSTASSNAIPPPAMLGGADLLSRPASHRHASLGHWCWWHEMKWLGRFISYLARIIHRHRNPSRRHHRPPRVHRPRLWRGDRRDRQVGDDCTIYQGVTLGGTSLHTGAKRHPTLGAA
jgi:23S rRNA (guanosine2251-2'-O)-methyltransferase